MMNMIKSIAIALALTTVVNSAQAAEKNPTPTGPTLDRARCEYIWWSIISCDEILEEMRAQGCAGYRPIKCAARYAEILAYQTQLLNWYNSNRCYLWT